MTAAIDCRTCLVKEVNEHISEKQKNVTFILLHLKGASVMIPKLKKAATLGHDSSVLVESENLRITVKKAIKSKCLHEKIK
jgi:hypothetical protein